MSSGIFLARKYISVPVFEHYFKPALSEGGIVIDDFHSIAANVNDLQILMSARGPDVKENLYKIMESTAEYVKEDWESNQPEWSSEYSRPDWAMAYFSLIDIEPKVLGIYNKDSTASEFFPAVALELIADNAKRKITELIDNSRSRLKSLGSDLSKM